MSVEIRGFDWDAGNRDKATRHGVSRAAIEALFGNEPRVFPDPEHLSLETRSLAIGQVNSGRFILAVFTLRRKDDGLWLRPISARYMHRREVEFYESKAQDTQEDPDSKD